MSPSRSVGAVLAVRAPRRRLSRIPRRLVPTRLRRHLRAHRQVLAGRAQVVLPHRRRIRARHHHLQEAVQALGQFLVVRVVRLRLPLSAVHQAVLLQRVTVFRAKRPTAARPIPTKVVLMPLAIIAPAQ